MLLRWNSRWYKMSIYQIILQIFKGTTILHQKLSIWSKNLNVPFLSIEFNFLKFEPFLFKIFGKILKILNYQRKNISEEKKGIFQRVSTQNEVWGENLTRERCDCRLILEIFFQWKVGHFFWEKCRATSWIFFCRTFSNQSQKIIIRPPIEFFKAA